MEAFAGRIGVHPGIVVGRLQHEGLLDYSQLNGFNMRLMWSPWVLLQGGPIATHVRRTDELWSASTATVNSTLGQLFGVSE
jgi:hypothetical protein